MQGFIVGFPTRYGMMAAQMKAFWDATGSFFASGGLVGKPITFFVSTGSINGGQETTALTALTIPVHHGMVYVPIGKNYLDCLKFDEDFRIFNSIFI